MRRFNKILYEQIMRNVSQSIKQTLNELLEGQIDGLKNVNIIRHYTTGYGLLSILNDGCIKAYESYGDNDWEKYNITNKKVISCHDPRTDTEWEMMIKSNNQKRSLIGTKTLGLNMNKVCACIELYFDKLPQKVKDNTHLLNIYSKLGEAFCTYWNLFCKLFDKYGDYLIKENNLELEIFTIMNNYNIELDRLIDIICYGKKPNDNEIECIHKIYGKYLKYYSDEIYSNKGEIIYNINYKFTIKEINKDFFINHFWHIIYGTYYMYKYDKIYNILKCRENLYNRIHLKFTDDDKIKVMDSCFRFDSVNIIKMLKKHGCDYINDFYTLLFNYENMYKAYFYFGSWQKFGLTEQEVIQDISGRLLQLLFTLSKTKSRNIYADLEIRIEDNIELNSNNCKIIIFDGICEGTKQKNIIKEVDKYANTYNIQHILPE